MKRRILSIALGITMLVGLMPTTALAGEADEAKWTTVVTEEGTPNYEDDGAGAGTLKEAFAAAPAYIQLQTGVTLNEGITVSSGTITLDLKGQTITAGTADITPINVDDTGTLTLIDSTGGGKIIGGADMDSSAVCVGWENSGGTLNIGNGTSTNTFTLKAGNNDYSYGLSSWGTVVVNQEFSVEAASGGPAISSSGTFTGNDKHITAKGEIRINNGTATGLNATVTDAYDALVLGNNLISVTITGGSYTGTRHGLWLYNTPANVVTISGGTFIGGSGTNNKAINNKGADTYAGILADGCYYTNGENDTAITDESTLASAKKLVVKSNGSSPAETHSHPLCGATCAHEGEHSAPDSWTKLTASDLSNGTLSLTDGNSYYLGEDIAVTKTVTISGTVNLCLNGHVLSGSGNRISTVTIQKNAVLNLCDCGTEATHKIIKGEQQWFLTDEGTDTIHGGVIVGGRGTYSDESGGGIIIQGGQLNMYAGSIIGGNVGKFGGGVFVTNSENTNGSFTMYDGTIAGNYTYCYGAGVYVKNGTFRLINGDITGNYANLGGGGVYVISAPSVFNMSGGSIDSNKANNNGSAGVTVLDGLYNLSGGKVINNKHLWEAAGWGGIYINGEFKLSGAPEISGNTSTCYETGGNIFLCNNRVITIEDELSNTTKIGVVMQNKTGVFTDGGENYQENFYSEEGYSVVKDGEGNLKLGEPAPAAAPSITTDTLPNGTVGEAYCFTLAASGDAPITWHVQSGLPTGLTLDSNTGEISGTPTIAGTFTVIVRATNSGGYDVKSLSITIAEAPAITNTYTVSVSADPAAGGTVSGGGTYDENASVTVTAAANDGYKFVKWTENDVTVSTDASYTFTATANRDLVAVFEQVNTDAFEVSGTITGAEGSTYTSVTAKLIELGGKEYNAVVDKTSENNPETYHYTTNAPAGHYNLVVTAKTTVGGNEVTVTVTSLIDLSSDTEKDAELPSGQKNSVVDTTASGDYHAIVGGLDEIAKNAGETNDIVEIKLTVTDIEENTVPPTDASAIKEKAQGSKLEFLDFTLTKKVNDGEPENYGSENTHLLTIMIAFDKTGVKEESICIYRYHDNQAEKMNKDPDSGAEGFVVGEGIITIYAKKFSTYAIGYTLEDTSSGDDSVINDSSNSNRNPKYDVKYEAENTENGSVEISRSRAAKGKTVTITVTPDEGYQLDELVILDKNGNEVEYKDNGDGTFTFAMPRGDVKIRASFAELEKEQLILIFAIDEKKYQKDDAELMNDVAPVIQCDRTMLPIRVVAENLGATVTWNEPEQSVTITMGDMEIVIYIGQSFALVDGCPVELDSPAFIANDRAYLPMRFVAENLGATVTWDGVNKTVTIVG